METFSRVCRRILAVETALIIPGPSDLSSGHGEERDLIEFLSAIFRVSD